MLRPYRRCRDGKIDVDDGMDVVWHDDKFVQGDVGEVGGDFVPDVLDDLAPGVQVHLAVNDFTEQWVALVGDDGDEIGTGFGIIIGWEADGVAIVGR